MMIGHEMKQDRDISALEVFLTVGPNLGFWRFGFDEFHARNERTGVSTCVGVCVHRWIGIAKKTVLLANATAFVIFPHALQYQLCTVTNTRHCMYLVLN